MVPLELPMQPYSELLHRFLGWGAGLLLWLVTSRERLGWLKLWQVWAGGVVALAVFLPNLIWNAGNGWASLAHQGQRLEGYGLSFGSMPDNLLDLLAGQAQHLGGEGAGRAHPLDDLW